MKSVFRSLFLLFAIVAVGGSVVVSAQTFAAGKRLASKNSIEGQVFHNILMLPNYGLFDNITFQINGGTVTLGGSVVSLGTKRDAERSIKRIPGVARVVNNIRELPLSSFDNQIRRSLVRKFEGSGVSRYLSGPNPSVRLIVDNGHVSLEGYVSNRSDANTMRVLALGIPGVFSVENHLILDSERTS
jgi:hyperosmotically inducible periplasmic protein